MSRDSLQAIIASAVLDKEFRRGLLHGSRLRLISNFNLTPEEISMVMGIKENTLEGFSGQLDQWINKTYGQPRLEGPSLPPGLHLRHHKKN